MGAFLAVLLAVLLGAHVSLAFGLARRRSRMAAVTALVVAPLAPFWGWSGGMRRRTIAWLAAAFAYALGVLASSAGRLFSGW
jgi:hypothetical protein